MSSDDTKLVRPHDGLVRQVQFNLPLPCGVCTNIIEVRRGMYDRGGMFVQMSDRAYAFGCCTSCVIELCGFPERYASAERYRRE